MDHANRLISSASPDEADCRSAVSRAYYSLFHESMELLETKKKMVRTETGEDHQLVYDVLNRLDGKIGQRYWSLKDYRNQADYRLTPTINRHNKIDATEIVRRMEKLISDIKLMKI